jgi:hypothetical protein
LHTAVFDHFDAVNDFNFLKHDAFLVLPKNPLRLWFNNQLRQQILARFLDIRKTFSSN